MRLFDNAATLVCGYGFGASLLSRDRDVCFFRISRNWAKVECRKMHNVCAGVCVCISLPKRRQQPEMQLQLWKHISCVMSNRKEFALDMWYNSSGCAMQTRFSELLIGSPWNMIDSFQRNLAVVETNANSRKDEKTKLTGLNRYCWRVCLN